MTTAGGGAHVHPGWGQNYGCGEAAYLTPEGVHVWMYRKGQKVRYFDRTGAQVGPEHANVVPAVVWAAANGWIDPSAPDLSLACILILAVPSEDHSEGTQ